MTRIVTLVLMVLSQAVNLFLGRVWYDLSKLNSKLADDIQRISAARLADDSAADFRASLAAQAHIRAEERRDELDALERNIDAMPVDELLCRVYSLCARETGSLSQTPGADPR